MSDPIHNDPSSSPIEQQMIGKQHGALIRILGKIKSIFSRTNQKQILASSSAPHIITKSCTSIKKPSVLTGLAWHKRHFFNKKPTTHLCKTTPSLYLEKQQASKDLQRETKTLNRAKLSLEVTRKTLRQTLKLLLKNNPKNIESKLKHAVTELEKLETQMNLDVIELERNVKTYTSKLEAINLKILKTKN